MKPIWDVAKYLNALSLECFYAFDFKMVEIRHKIYTPNSTKIRGEKFFWFMFFAVIVIKLNSTFAKLYKFPKTSLNSVQAFGLRNNQ